MVLPDTLVCTKCLKEKNPDEFGNDRTRPTGKYPWCKMCAGAHQHALWERENPEKVRRKREGLRRCSKCKEEKPPETFSKRGERYKSHCKVCVAENHAAKHQPKPPGPIPTESQICTKCRTEKPLAEFYNNKRNPSGKSFQCKACAAEYYAENRERILAVGTVYAAEHKEETAARHANWYQENKENILKKQLTHTRIRQARKAGAPVVEKVSTEYIFTRDKGICQICLKPCKLSEANIDHVIPLSKGGEHSRRNCVLAHSHCNQSKGNRVVTQQMRLLP